MVIFEFFPLFYSSVFDVIFVNVSFSDIRQVSGASFEDDMILFNNFYFLLIALLALKLIVFVLNRFY